MKHENAIRSLVYLIATGAIIASFFALLSSGGPGEYDIETIRGETVTIFGSGLYQDDSVSVAAQGKAQDVVTLLLAVPLLLVALQWAKRGSLKGTLLLTGTLGYFLYSYTSYTFLSMYNPFFLLYVFLMSASFFAFTLSMMSFDVVRLGSAFGPKLPVKFIGGFQITIAVLLLLMWLGRIVPPLMDETVPLGLEHYTTLVIQAMDLGFIVPVAMVSGILILKRKPFGYLLSSVMIMNSISLLTAISAMIIGQAIAGIEMSLVEVILFPVFNLVAIYCLVLLLMHVNDPGSTEKQHFGKVS